jgi:hypothetical protein
VAAVDGIEEAIEALAKAEKLVNSVDRASLLAKLDELRDFIEDLSRLQLDMRIARLRLQTLLPERDPDRTPARGISTAEFRKVHPEK